jgi:hypothetical protein
VSQVKISSRHTMVFVAASLVLFAGGAWTQERNTLPPQSVDSGSSKMNDTNAANNPLESLLTVDLQDRFEPSPEGFPDRNANVGELRVAVPIDTFGLHQFVRTIVPINTTVPGGTGVGDLQVYDILPFEVGRITLGAGPLVVAPTASGNSYGLGKWQLGAAAGLIDPQAWGLLALLATYQHSVSGDGPRPDGAITTVQPFFFYHFADGVYFRSSGVMTFDTFHHVQYIPLGVGFGKVCTSANGNIANFYLEPQYSVYQSGVGSPSWQIFAGVTFKFPVRRR